MSLFDDIALAYLWGQLKTKLSNYQSLAPIVAIPSSADLDDYVDPGTYYVSDSTVAATLTNTPFKSFGFMLSVIKTYGLAATNAYRLQVAVNYVGTVILRYRNSSSVWSAWKMLRFTDTTYTDATVGAAGLMSAADKSKLDGFKDADEYALQSDIDEVAVHYGTCTTAAATAAKVATVAGTPNLAAGTAVRVKFTYSNTAASPTLNVNGTGAIAIKKYGTTAVTTYMWMPGAVVDFVYDGTYWIMLNGGTATTTYYGTTKLSSSTSSTSTTLAATPSAVKAAYDLAAAAMPKTGGTFTGPVYAGSGGQTANSYAIRNSKLSATEEAPTVEGQICWQYE